MRYCSAIFLIMIFAVQMLFAHGGGLDSNGGHHDRKNGGYHYHRTVTPPDPIESTPVTRAPPPTEVPAYADRTRTSYRTTARTSARVEPVQSYRAVASNDYSSQPHIASPPAKSKVRLEPHFRVWLANGTTKDIVSYTEHDDRYMFALTYGGSIGFPKSVIMRIEALPVSTAAGS